MRIPGIKTARLFSRWLRGRLSGGALILGYHSIGGPGSGAYETSISSALFAEHMEIIHRYAHPIRLSALVQHLSMGTLPRKSVAVTFDDGYADNLYCALPVLQRYQIPATVFISTGFQGKAFWWDELEQILMRAELPPVLQLKIGGEQFVWKFHDPQDMVGDAAKASSRKRLGQQLSALLLPLTHKERRAAMDQIQAFASSQTAVNDNHRALTSRELLALAGDDLIEIGSHTVSHPVLPDLEIERQKSEIQGSKAILEAQLAKPVRGFSYPNGSFSNETREAVRSAGYRFACGSLHGLAYQLEQAFSLPRYWPQDWDGDRFYHQMKIWLGL